MEQNTNDQTTPATVEDTTTHSIITDDPMLQQVVQEVAKTLAEFLQGITGHPAVQVLSAEQLYVSTALTAMLADERNTSAVLESANAIPVMVQALAENKNGALDRVKQKIAEVQGQKATTKGSTTQSDDVPKKKVMVVARPAAA